MSAFIVTSLSQVTPPCHQQYVIAQHQHVWSDDRTPKRTKMWFRPTVCGWQHEHLSDDAFYHLSKLAARLPCRVWNQFNTDQGWWSDTQKPTTSHLSVHLLQWWVMSDS